ncbi:sugar transferase [Cyanobium sp. HWJ4-Hawea]|uniref:sugar transferase n=1 Tax=Cyanobium sp. HWJ4-Hawea TaxID=2823713 RepID=UPI0020CF8D56|nr:sugar transferase [Cyanobium sp. HWJ4-Hawea]
MVHTSLSLQGQLGWIATSSLVYLFWNWLLGTYSILAWRRLARSILLQRSGLCLIATLVSVVILRGLVNPPESVWIVYRSHQVAWLLPATIWAMLVRFAIRQSTLILIDPSFLLVAPEQEASEIMKIWNQSNGGTLQWLSGPEAVAFESPKIVAISPALLADLKLLPWLEELRAQESREVTLTTPIALASKYLQRLPPSFLSESDVSQDEIPWADTISLSRQLKRAADIFLSLGLLFAMSPLILIATLLIWLEDRGPIFYRQIRSGFLGRPFEVYKLRTMVVSSPVAPASWTVINDSRITKIGRWLRKSRLDELPQLINVIRGDMSLIGPRPERPEFEHRLEESIQHYRKRHWMPPGLSGWAQVCAPYASSVEDSEVKLSYDLWYLKKFSVALDLVIAFRTCKVVLKMAGR